MKTETVKDREGTEMKAQEILLQLQETAQARALYESSKRDLEKTLGELLGKAGDLEIGKLSTKRNLTLEDVTRFLEALSPSGEILVTEFE